MIQYHQIHFPLLESPGDLDEVFQRPPEPIDFRHYQGMGKIRRRQGTRRCRGGSGTACGAARKKEQPSPEYRDQLR
ncbi:hypothetical protein GCM10007170_38690 [Arthrobacter liuii]|uniref:Uncharacterized protein n=1 Tax=Arthrobacter liuii TaxID=1476996 RepID=A0ABQ2AXJ0_9MICC|nr:hypothetical protein GCM10007170_38690 [Arthrobacter liuii]